MTQFYKLLFVDIYDDNENDKDHVHEFARIFGTEHPWFWRVHITALCALSMKYNLLLRIKPNVYRNFSQLLSKPLNLTKNVNMFSRSGTSILVSIATLIFLIFSGKEWNIFRRKFSERLVVYLAVADILYRRVYVIYFWLRYLHGTLYS